MLLVTMKSRNYHMSGRIIFQRLCLQVRLRNHVMITFIALVLKAMPLLGADTGITVVTTVKTNQSGSVTTRDVFKRDGQTNLVRIISSKSGAMGMRIHRFYYHGLLMGDYVATPDSSNFTTAAGSAYSVGFEFGPTNNVQSAVIGTKDGTVLDAFMATNGIFYPVDSSLLKKANDIGGDMAKLFSPANVTNATPKEFQQEVEDLIEKHKAQ
jgi:hypothetical protein